MLAFRDNPLTSYADGVRRSVHCSNPACGVTYTATEGVFHIPALRFNHEGRHTFMAVPYCTKTCERLHLHAQETTDGLRQTALAL